MKNSQHNWSYSADGATYLVMIWLNFSCDLNNRLRSISNYQNAILSVNLILKKNVTFLAWYVDFPFGFFAK